METVLQLAAWGGSTALRIPKNFLQELGIADKSSVKLRIGANRELIVTPVYCHKTLAERFEGWDGTLELSGEDKEWLEMETVGEEI
jgi:antitoxin component of MazEF toxin-antitoxin module